MTTDGSMAVWSEHRIGGTSASAEVHFNYWRIQGDTTFVARSGGAARDFVEVGVLLNNPDQARLLGFICQVAGREQKIVARALLVQRSPKEFSMNS
jgi:hypothetical protein